jgi:hypothetical protein
MILDKIRRGTAMIEEALRDFDPALLAGDEAADLIRLLTKTERVVVAVKTLSVIRVEETKIHEREGHKTAGTWLASVTAEPLGQAIADVEGARQIAENTEVKEAFRSGDLSEAQAKQIASAKEQGRSVRSRGSILRFRSLR